MGALSDGELSRVEDVIKDPLKHGIPPRMVNRRKDIETGRDMHLVGADLALKIKSDIDLMKDIKSWKGIRHSIGLKGRGQRTRTTGRSGKAVGVKKKVLMEAARAAASGKKEEKKEWYLGDPKKPRKTYETPRHPWRKEQLEAELHLLGEYGLRNKRELRRHETMLSKIRGIARSLLGATEEQKSQIETQYLRRLARLGILPESASVDNILDLNVKDLMERRLQTIVYRSGLARSIHQARQFVSHGHISIANEIVSVPSYIVKRDEESRIAFNQRSPLTNAQHPARAAPGGKRLARVIEEAPIVVPAITGLPAVPPEVKEEVQAEQPLVLVEPDEELAAEPEPEKK